MAGNSEGIKRADKPLHLTEWAARVRHLGVSESIPYLSADGAVGTLLNIRVSPGSRKNAVEGMHGDALRIRVAAPPVDGKANKALVAFLAKTFGVPKKSISLLRGEKSRDKTFAIAGLSPGEVARLLEAAGS